MKMNIWIVLNPANGPVILTLAFFTADSPCSGYPIYLCPGDSLHLLLLHFLIIIPQFVILPLISIHYLHILVCEAHYYSEAWFSWQWSCHFLDPNNEGNLTKTKLSTAPQNIKMCGTQTGKGNEKKKSNISTE